MHELSQEYKRYGYRRICQLLNREGWGVNHKKVQRIWRQEGLRIPRIRRKKRALGHAKSGLIERSARFPNEIWCYDFLFDVTAKGQRLKIMPVLDEFTRRCLALVVEPSLTGDDVTEVLGELFESYGAPKQIRSDNGPEYICDRVRTFLRLSGVEPLFIEPGSPWQNGIVESFNARLRDEVLEREEFWGLLDAKVVLKEFKELYNERRPHGALD